MTESQDKHYIIEEDLIYPGYFRVFRTVPHGEFTEWIPVSDRHHLTYESALEELNRIQR